MALVKLSDDERTRLEDTLEEAREVEVQQRAAVNAGIGDMTILQSLQQSIAKLEAMLEIF
tara:strand:- start:1506 stop:1685 length:180 start_codon:yes stop_codon:yes gene_type:complete